MSFLSAPWTDDKPSAECLWEDNDRTLKIATIAESKRVGGDVVVKRGSASGGNNNNGNNNNAGKGKQNEGKKQPPENMEDVKPIQVNDAKRWKAKVFSSTNPTNTTNPTNDEDKTEAQNTEILSRALLILNKLSLTKFDKLSSQFISCGIGQSEALLSQATGMIVKKAQEEPHFSAMYAGLCLKLAEVEFGFENEASASAGGGGGGGASGGKSKKKRFKKILLERCQVEFETETSVKIAEATRHLFENEADSPKDKDDAATTTDSTQTFNPSTLPPAAQEEYEYHATLIKKHYLGHMRFIGELYKGDLISVKIMLACLPQLLMLEEESADQQEGQTTNDGNKYYDEEKIECFAKLMTVIGSSLERQSEAMKNVGKTDAAENLAECWKTVEILAGRRKQDGGGACRGVSNRIKFMLQDLLEMKSNGWVTRRQEESAKTIAQIHNDVAKEERARRSMSTNTLQKMNSKGGVSGSSSSSMRRGGSSGDVRNMDKAQKRHSVMDGDGFVSVVHNTNSSSRVHKSSSMSAMFSRSQSDVGGWQTAKPSAASRFGASAAAAGGSTMTTVVDNADEKKKNATSSTPKQQVPSPDQCGEKAKNILKEYLVGGDTEDAILSLHELIQHPDTPDSHLRGTKVVESSILYILETKFEQVDKFIPLLLRLAAEKKITSEMLTAGMNDPLEFLEDVIVDAPLAGPILIRIISTLIKSQVIEFKFLLDSPEYFRTDQNAALFGARVVKEMGVMEGEGGECYLEVIEKLMTEDDKGKFGSAKEMVDDVDKK